MNQTLTISQHEIDDRINAINKVFKNIGIDRAELAQLDHIAYRTETLHEYKQVVEGGRGLGEDLGEVMVQGRPITIIALKEPFQSGGWTIDFLEIVAPKESSPYPSGVEHAEFVTRGLLKDFEAKHSDLNFIRDAMGRDINPELKFREQGISVKFHQLNIGAVVKIEDALGSDQEDE